VDGDDDQRDEADGDDRMDYEREPMPGGRIRAFGLALDQDAIFVFLADDFWHRLSRMISDRGLESRPVE
jgi:hypothetical protein